MAFSRPSVRKTKSTTQPESSFDVRQSLPAPEEVATDAAANRRSPVSKRLLALIAMAVFVVAAIIGLSVSVAARSKTEAQNADITRDNNVLPGEEGDPGRSPSDDLTARGHQIVDYMVQFAYTDRNRMQTAGSPQALAVQWMAENDPAPLEVPTTTDYDEAVQFVQRYVLAVLYYSTNGDSSWTHSLFFLSDYDVCDWYEEVDLGGAAASVGGSYEGWASGVQCNENGEVNYVFIPDNGLTGELPAELGLLVSMNYFSVYGNQISGGLPESMEEWEDVTLLALESNAFSGSIPTWLSSLTSLEYLALGKNGFSGDLPDIFGSMPSLTEVSLHENALTGTFDRFNENTSLETLLLHRNQLTGSLQADTLENVPVRTLDMSNNQISGSLPLGFYDVEMVSLHHNKLTGSLPEPGQGHIVTFLSLFDNEISGDLPVDLGNLSWLMHLDLSYNKLGGVIPESINSCQNMVYLYLGDNDFLARDMADLSDLPNLQELSLRNTQITGTVPDWLGTWLTNLVFLDLRENELGQALPLSFENLEGLQFLLLSHNAFEGIVPNEFWWMQDLKVLSVDHNLLTGSIGDLCEDDGPPELDWLVADTAVECSCCSSQCEDGDDACGGNTILTPNVDDGFERTQFILNAQLIFSVGAQSN